MTWRERSKDSATILPWVSVRSEPPILCICPRRWEQEVASNPLGGACWRFRESEFQMKTIIEERLGKKALPEAHTLVDWPISYEDLEPYYDRVEWGTAFQAVAAISPDRVARVTIRGKHLAVVITQCRRCGKGPRINVFLRRVQETGISPVPDGNGHCVSTIQRPLWLHVLRVLPRLSLPCKRQDVHSRRRAAEGPGQRQFGDSGL